MASKGVGRRDRRVEGDDGVVITSTFYWPPVPSGIMIYTAPLSHWVETVITGLTTEPIVLHDWYSQTYRPGHHNITEYFIFEPRLEPGMSPQILNELTAQNIQYLYVEGSPGPGEPVDILVNGVKIGKGEVVVVDEQFGIRITHLLSPRDRVQKLA